MDAVPSVSFSVSATTRPARSHEIDGVHYHFMSLPDFERHLADGRLLESEEVYPGCWYGTLLSVVEKSHKEAPILLDIDVVGALRVKEHYRERCLALFISPPSAEELESRLRARGTESEKSLAERSSKARYELTFADSFDHVVVNDDLETAVKAVIDLVSDFIRRC